MLRADPKKMREHVFFRDDGVCARCGKKHESLNADWEADHVMPLMVAFGDPRFWEPSNVVILCLPCHKKKSAEDRRRYRKKQRRKWQERLIEED